MIRCVRQHEMETVKFLNGRQLRIGGIAHSGWLPPGAAKPLPTPVRELVLNLEILFDGHGYLLCYASADGTLFGDTWHESLADAEHAASLYFGIDFREWIQK